METLHGLCGVLKLALLKVEKSPKDSVLSILVIQAHLLHIRLDLIPPSSLGSFGQSFAFRPFSKNCF